MARHGIELFGYLFALNSYLFTLLTDHGDALDQWLELLLQPGHRFHGAINKDRNRDHRHSDDDERQSNHHHHPEHGIVWIYLQGKHRDSVISDCRFPIADLQTNESLPLPLLIEAKDQSAIGNCKSE